MATEHSSNSSHHSGTTFPTQPDHDQAVLTTGHTIHWAPFYDPLVSLMTLSRSRSLRAMTLELANPAPGDAVLDVGCGTGELTLLASECVGPTGQVVGIDAAPEMIAVARSKASERQVPIDFRVAAIEELPFPDHTFGVALSSLMMHHLPADLKRRGLREVRRVLKPGGRVVIVDAMRPTSWLGRALITILGHGQLREGVQDLGQYLTEARFSCIEIGATRWPVIGFARGQTPDDVVG